MVPGPRAREGSDGGLPRRREMNAMEELMSRRGTSTCSLTRDRWADMGLPRGETQSNPTVHLVNHLMASSVAAAHGTYLDAKKEATEFRFVVWSVWVGVT